MRPEMLLQHRKAVTCRGRNHEGLGKGKPFVRRRCQLQKLRPRDEIDLVQDQNPLGLDVFERTQNLANLLVEALARIDEQSDDIGIGGAAPGRGDHGTVEPPPRCENARRIDENDLRLVLQRDAAHEHTRRLHFARDDRDFGADKGVEQRRFAGVRRADQRNEAAAPLRGVNFAHC